MSVLKRKDFARWQAGEKLPDAVLCKAVHEMEAGLIDADLGGFLYKKRVARPGSGKSGGYRTLLSARIGSRYVFLHGFPKSDKANIAQDERKALQFAGKVFLELTAEDLVKALEIGVLLEVCCDEQTHCLPARRLGRAARRRRDRQGDDARVRCHLPAACTRIHCHRHQAAARKFEIQPTGIRAAPTHHGIHGAQVGTRGYPPRRAGTQAAEHHCRQGPPSHHLMTAETEHTMTTWIIGRLAMEYGC